MLTSEFHTSELLDALAKIDRACQDGGMMKGTMDVDTLVRKAANGLWQSQQRQTAT